MTPHSDIVLDFTHEQLPGRIVFGAGRRHDLRSEIEAFDPTGVLIVGGSHDGVTVSEIEASLAVAVDTIVGVRPHVPAELVSEALEVVDRARPTAVVTVGGGSATGLGKMIARDRDVALVAVPTTYAGSEMTPIWGTTTDGVKQTGRSPRVLPATVVYDPELTVGLSRSATVNSAFNAMAHCAEALWLPDTSPITAEAAVAALRAIVDGVVAVAADPADVDARARLLYGAHRAGSVLAVAGTGLLHRAAHALGGMFDLDHGGMYAVLTPLMVEHHLATTPWSRSALIEALGDDPAAALARLAVELGAPLTLTDLGLPPERAVDAVEVVSRQAGVGADVIGPLLDLALSPRSPEEPR